VVPNAWPKGSPCPLKARQYQTGLIQEGEIKPRRGAYCDGIVRCREQVKPSSTLGSPKHERLTLLLFDLNAPAMDQPRSIGSFFERKVKILQPLGLQA
jgi:hypothetical protein